MAEILADRMTAEIDGPFVVFLIGVRINRPWRIDIWLPVVRAMGRTQAELAARPAEETGLLGQISKAGLFIQYWRSFDHLEAWARDRDSSHWPAWKEFNRRFAKSRGDIGIWHETYAVEAGRYETVYSGMPVFGLGAAGRIVPAAGRRNAARGRLEGPGGGAAGDQPAAAPSAVDGLSASTM